MSDIEKALYQEFKIYLEKNYEHTEKDRSKNSTSYYIEDFQISLLFLDNLSLVIYHGDNSILEVEGEEAQCLLGLLKKREIELEEMRNLKNQQAALSKLRELNNE